MKFFIMIFLSLILAYGSDKDCKSVDIMGTNELIFAADSLNLKRFATALDGCNAKDVYALRFKGSDLLDMAIEGNFAPIVQYLLEKYPRFSLDEHRIFKYVSKDSINYKDPEMIELLLNFGKFSINVTDAEGKTILHHIVYDPQIFEIKYVLSKGIDTTLKDNEGLDALSTAKKWLTFHQEMAAKHPWAETKKRIARVQKAIALIEDYNAQREKKMVDRCNRII